MGDGFAERISAVRKRIAAAAERAGRAADEITLISVSKTHPAGTLGDAAAAGVSVFGENKVQEGVGKIEELGRDGLEWHLIGHLQKNKARKAVTHFDVIQTIDSVALAKRLDRICTEEGRGELPVLIQVDVSGEASKSGIGPGDLYDLAAEVAATGSLKLKGLMAIPPYFKDTELVRPYFRRLRDLRDDLAAKGLFSDELGELSMGMSHDFEIAIEEGATMVRVGTAIFGPRGVG